MTGRELDGFAVDTQELFRFAELLNQALGKLDCAITRIDANLFHLAEARYPRQWLQEIAEGKKSLKQNRYELENLLRLLREIAARYDSAEAANQRLVDALCSFVGEARSRSTRLEPMPGVAYSYRINQALSHESWLLEMAIQNANDEVAGDNG